MVGIKVSANVRAWWLRNRMLDIFQCCWIVLFLRGNVQPGTRCTYKNLQRRSGIRRDGQGWERAVHLGGANSGPLMSGERGRPGN